GSTSSGAKWPAFAIRKTRLDGSSSAYTMVTKRPLGKSSIIMLLRRVKTSAGPEPVCASERSMPRVADMRGAAAVPLPETSARTKPQRPSGKGMKSYQSPPTEPAGIERPETRNPGIGGGGRAGHGEPQEQRRGAREQSLLNRARFFSLAAHALPLFAFIAKALGVVYRHGN